MRIKKSLYVFVAGLLAVSLCGCSSTPKAELSKVVLVADVTHDESKEKIVGNITDADKGEAYVSIYKQASDNKSAGTLIWKDTLGTKKKDYKAIYLAKKSNEFYILIWKPTFKGKYTTLELAIFSLEYNYSTQVATPVNEISRSVTFTDEQVTKDGDMYKEATSFVYRLNKYLSKSAAIVDTVGGKLVYTDNPKDCQYKEYHPDWYNEDDAERFDKEYENYTPNTSSTDITSQTPSQITDSSNN